jgi:hypothetical protein
MKSIQQLKWPLSASPPQKIKPKNSDAQMINMAVFFLQIMSVLLHFEALRIARFLVHFKSYKSCFNRGREFIPVPITSF